MCIYFKLPLHIKGVTLFHINTTKNYTHFVVYAKCNMVVKCIYFIIWFNGYCFDMKYFVCLRVWDYAYAKIQFTEL